MATALEAYEVVGVVANLGLLRAIVKNPAFLAADLDTGFIGRHIRPEVDETGANHIPLVAAALAVLAGQYVEKPSDPWDVADSFRLNVEGEQEVSLRAGEAVMSIRAVPLGDRTYRLVFGDVAMTAGSLEDGVSIDGVIHRLHVVRDREALIVIQQGRNHVFTLIDKLRPPGALGAGDDRVVAPIPAKVTHILVHAGDVVAKGAALVVLEAMKMEITLTAPRDGTIDVVRYVVGDMVEEGTELIHFT